MGEKSGDVRGRSLSHGDFSTRICLWTTGRYGQTEATHAKSIKS